MRTFKQYLAESTVNMNKPADVEAALKQIDPNMKVVGRGKPKGSSGVVATDGRYYLQVTYQVNGKFVNGSKPKSNMAWRWLVFDKESDVKMGARNSVAFAGNDMINKDFQTIIDAL